MRLADIRCETCPSASLMMAYPGRLWCLEHQKVRHPDQMCSHHPDWQKALAEEREKEEKGKKA